MDIIEKVKVLSENEAKNLNITIEDVEWVNEAGVNILRILADTDEGLNIDQATELNNKISEALDKENFIDEEYMLEVSSLGVERELKTEKDILKNINQYVHIDFVNNFLLEKYLLIDIEGYLRNYENETFTLEVNLKGKIKKINIKKEEIKKIRKAIKF